MRSRTTLCDRLAAIRHPLLLPLVDYGTCGTQWFEAHVPLPFARVLRDSFMDAIANGDANKDWSAIARVAARRAGLQA